MAAPANIVDSPFKICDLQNPGKAVIATRQLAANEAVFQEPVFLSVKTFMILSGVVVLRRSKVEDLYAQLGEDEKRHYRSLHPMNEVCESEVAEGSESIRGNPESKGSLRQRATGSRTGDSSNAESAAEKQTDTDLKPPTAQQHRDIWDKNGLHYCDDADVKVNRILHLVLCPAVLTLISGCAWAYVFKGSYLKSILGAAILFFAVLGPVGMRAFYVGSQALCLNASRVNHSCKPNSAWQIDGQRLPLGEKPAHSRQRADTSATEAETGTANGAPMKLTLFTKQVVKEGEEITIDYIPELVHLDASERRNLLKQEYGFLCSCARCAAEKSRGDMEEEEEVE